jgi:hypothetical protein
MQRLHEDDLVGHVLAQEEWEVVAFPAIAETGEEHVVETPFGRKRFARQAGEVLHPEHEPLVALEQIRASLGSYNFAGQYQQTPAPAGGGLVKEAWFQRYEPHDLPPRLIKSSRAGTPPTSHPSSPIIRSAQPGASRARTFIY